jgi:hypothetical protein
MQMLQEMKTRIIIFSLLTFALRFQSENEVTYMSEKLSKLQSKCKKKHWWIGYDLSFHWNTLHETLMAYTPSTKTSHVALTGKKKYVILFCISDPWKCSLQANHCHCQGSNILFQFLGFCLDMIEKERKWKRHISGNVTNKNFHSMKRGKKRYIFWSRSWSTQVYFQRRTLAFQNYKQWSCILISSLGTLVEVVMHIGIRGLVEGWSLLPGEVEEEIQLLVVERKLEVEVI